MVADVPFGQARDGISVGVQVRRSQSSRVGPRRNVLRLPMPRWGVTGHARLIVPAKNLIRAAFLGRPARGTFIGFAVPGVAAARHTRRGPGGYDPWSTPQHRGLSTLTSQAQRRLEHKIDTIVNRLVVAIVITLTLLFAALHY